MKAARIAAVVPGVDAAQIIDFDAEGIAAPFGEDFEPLLFGVIAPDVLADHVDRGILAARAHNVGGDGTAVGAVKPAVGPPAQAVGAGVGVLQAEALQMDDGRPAG